ncbi:DUF445 domain-containing protein [Desulfitobacterium sp.]|uniref:DUF445 domain-containing protein n=1 Tax=Desulfitobacterium sp. TaxID=49981 RepID=UPI002BA1C528|nr:DUF445 domain-containing protein [Desulfitobacterium sp.]HVJ49874.1 DUF445 domain-containing protein [Desulfitobacterium sp.]
MNYRRRANAVLSIVFILFILVSGAKYLWPGNFILRFCQFVLEASLVGGIADWFAVTALFRKPLGWPYHTALIPRNRTKMIEGIRAMVEKELLSQAMIEQKIQGLKFSRKILGAVEERGGTDFLTEKLAVFLSSLKAQVVGDKVAGQFSALIRIKAQDLGIARKILAYSQSLLHRQEFDRWLDERIEDLLVYASGSSVHFQIQSYLENLKEQQLTSGGFWQKTLLGVFQAADGLNLDEAADALQTHLILSIRRLKYPENDLRIQLKSQLALRFQSWENDGLTEGQIEEWLEQILAELPLESYLETGIEKVLSAWQEGKSINGESLVVFLKPIVVRFWATVQADSKLQETFDMFFRDTLLQLAKKEHRLIGEIVQETLEDLSDDELNQFIEDKAGNDLQWIRINGSIVGGILGIILFIVLNFGYQPLLMVLK